MIEKSVQHKLVVKYEIEGRTVVETTMVRSRAAAQRFLNELPKDGRKYAGAVMSSPRDVTGVFVYTPEEWKVGNVARYLESGHIFKVPKPLGE